MTTTAQQYRLAGWLRGHGYDPEIEYWVERCGITVDLAYPELRFAIEVDGGYHTTWKQKEEDGFRDESLRKAGWDFVRVTNDDIDASLSAVGYRVLAKLRKREKSSLKTRRSSELPRQYPS